MMSLFWVWAGGWATPSFFLWVAGRRGETTITEACFGATIWPFMIPCILFKGRKKEGSDDK